MNRISRLLLLSVAVMTLMLPNGLQAQQQPQRGWGFPVWQQPAQSPVPFFAPQQRPDATTENTQPSNPAAADRRRPERTEDMWRNISDRIKAERVMYFTNRIQLTPAEAQAFWPIYNELDEKKDVLYKQRADIAMRYMQHALTLTDRELETMLNQYWQIYQKEYKLTSDYHKKFLSVLSPAKVMKLYMVEEQFKNSYLQRMRAGGQPMGGTEPNRAAQR